MFIVVLFELLDKENELIAVVMVATINGYVFLGLGSGDRHFRSNSHRNMFLVNELTAYEDPINKSDICHTNFVACTMKNNSSFV